jgi:hypothetical protein
MENKLHLNSLGLDIIVKIKSNMNKGRKISL